MKRQIILDEYEFSDGDLRVIFTFDEKEYIEDFIDENSFEEYIEDSGRLEYFEDRWDGYTESHYTKDYIVDYSEWRDESCESGDILDFLDYYYKTNKVPEPIEE
jgi:hypothetical protein